MVHYISLYKLQDGISDEELDEMIRAARSQLLKIPEVHQIRTGRNVGESPEWPFFLAIDFESLDKMEMYRDDPIFSKFDAEIIKTRTTENMELMFETDPGKDTKYS